MDHDHADPARAGSLHHVELCTTDLEAAADFWGWILDELGYRLKNEWTDGRSWIKGPTYIVIKTADNPDHPFDRREAGLNHLAFHAESRDQVDAVTASVRSRADASVLYEDQHPYAGGYYALYSEGPDGIKLELVAPESTTHR